MILLTPAFATIALQFVYLGRVGVLLQGKDGGSAVERFDPSTLKRRTQRDYERVLEITTEASTLAEKMMGPTVDGRVLCKLLLGNITENDDFLEQGETPHLPPTLVSVTINRTEGELRDSDTLWSLYGLRLVADTLGNIDIRINVTDTNHKRGNSALPWVSGFFPGRAYIKTKDASRVPSYKHVCTGKARKPLQYKLNDMQYELRRMAVALVGVPNPDHPSAAFAEKYMFSQKQYSPSWAELAQPPSQEGQQGFKPIFPETELDDAIFYVECRDFDPNTQVSNLINFDAYLSRIPPETTRSIGIVTPRRDIMKKHGSTAASRCSFVVDAFIKFIRRNMPNVRVKHRNSETEPITLFYTRFIMANQTILPISKSYLFPALATFGTAYIREPISVNTSNGWMLEPRLTDFCDNVVFIRNSMMRASQMKQFWKLGNYTIADWMEYSNYRSIILKKQIATHSRNVSITTRNELSILVGELRAYMMPGTRLCEGMLGNISMATFNTTSYVPPLSINVVFNSADVYGDKQYGTGNVLWALYSLRLIADAIGNIDVTITATDAESTKRAIVYPWVTGFFPRTVHHVPVHERKDPTLEEACRERVQKPLLYKTPDIQFELRRMAVALVGIPHPAHPSAAFAEKYLYSSEGSPSGAQLALPLNRDEPPLFPNVQLDDVILHFRCGDLIVSKHESYGFMRFGSYARHISQEARSIGIATQPFESGNFSRAIDVGSAGARCKLVVEAFVRYLQTRFPAATVAVRNDPNETSALAFARMIMANQTVVGVSSFGVFPALATFGSSYIRKPKKDFTNGWLIESDVKKSAKNVLLVEEPILSCSRITTLWARDNGKTVLKLFQGESENHLLNSPKQGTVIRFPPDVRRHGNNLPDRGKSFGKPHPPSIWGNETNSTHTPNEKKSGANPFHPLGMGKQFRQPTNNMAHSTSGGYLLRSPNQFQSEPMSYQTKLRLQTDMRSRLGGNS